MSIHPTIARVFAGDGLNLGRPLLLLAPMAGISDAPFRQVARRFGADLAVSEMIASQAMIRRNARSLKIGLRPEGEWPLVVQIAGADPGVMAEAARMNAGLGADIIDINMGCPVRKIVRTGAGAALLADPERAARIVEAVVAAVSVPVTVKLRLGVDRQRLTGLEVAVLAQERGVAWVTVHGRTAAEMYRGQADYEGIARIKAGLTIPVIGNGDVVDGPSAQRLASETGVDGVMIGRGALGNPWIFREVAHYFGHRQPLPGPLPAERLAVVREHFAALLAFHGEVVGNRLARKHLCWYAHGMEGAARFREAVNRAGGVVAARQLLEEFFGGVDERRVA
ncbi:MAG: tRNA dihydrouridine synthase DusB [Magnetococcales bacterium]|nr:tRNA dihydrouridine synthase DusB [Magnetococcales bacterium]